MIQFVREQKVTKAPIRGAGLWRLIMTSKINSEVIHEFSYRNPFVLATMYYVDGYSTVEMAQMLSCHDRTIRRYMDKYGLRRYTKTFSAYVHLYGIERALEVSTPEYYYSVFAEVADNATSEQPTTPGLV